MELGTKAKSDEACPGAPRPATSVTRRLVYALALLPIVPAVSFVGMYIIDECFGFGPLEGFRWFHLLFSILWVVATIVIWKRLILWTLGRKWLTVLISTIPFVQVVYARPLWDAGCVSEEFLRVGQHEVGIAFWVWITVWIWWGWERLNMSDDTGKTELRGPRLSPPAQRLAASIGTIPFVFAAFLIILVALDDVFGLTDPAPATFALAALVAIVVWVLVWRRLVVWSAVVIRRTAAAALLCLGLPIALLSLFWQPASEFVEVVLGCLPIIGWGVWMAVTIATWPVLHFGPAEPDSAPRCLRCGYLLIGLRSTRCPECGDEPTLDELWRGLSVSM